MDKGLTWGRRLAWAAIFIAVASPLCYRLQLLELGLALQALVLAFLVAIIASLLLGARLIISRQRPISALAALAAAVLFVAIMGAMIRDARRYPPIHDITTDLVDVPQFNAAADLRLPSDNTLAVTQETLAAQRAAYPDIAPIFLGGAPRKHFARLLDTARDMGWEIVAQNVVDGTFDAVATTLAFGFKDDITVRIRPRGLGSRIDIRSASRLGRSDLGVNAKRIRAFAAALAD